MLLEQGPGHHGDVGLPLTNGEMDYTSFLWNYVPTKTTLLAGIDTEGSVARSANYQPFENIMWSASGCSQDDDVVSSKLISKMLMILCDLPLQS